MSGCAGSRRAPQPAAPPPTRQSSRYPTWKAGLSGCARDPCSIPSRSPRCSAQTVTSPRAMTSSASISEEIPPTRESSWSRARCGSSPASLSPETSQGSRRGLRPPRPSTGSPPDERWKSRRSSSARAVVMTPASTKRSRSTPRSSPGLPCGCDMRWTAGQGTSSCSTGTARAPPTTN